jgi:iron complex transport system substrate-binding protein
MYRSVLLLLAVFLVACGAPAATNPPTDMPAPTDAPTAAPAPTNAPAPTDAPTAAPAPTSAPAPTPAAPAGDTLTFTDATGASVTLERAPERIVCVTEICVDILADLGLEPVAVAPGGVTPLPEFFGERAQSFAIIGGSFFEPSLEDIAAAQPDLVIGLAGVHEGLRDGLAAIAPLYIMGPQTYQDSIAYLEDIGRLTGREAEAADRVQAFEAKLAAYGEQAPKDRTVLAMWGMDVNFGIDTAGSLVGSMLSELTNYPWPAPAPGSEGHASGGMQFSLEQVLVENPDVLFVQTFGFGPVPPEPLSVQLAANPLWSEIAAVQNNEVHEVSFAVWSTGRGLRSLTLVLDEAMPLIYPDVFPQPLP